MKGVAAASTAAGLAWDSGPAWDPVLAGAEAGRNQSRDPGRSGWDSAHRQCARLAPAPARGPGPRAPLAAFSSALQSLPRSSMRGAAAPGAGSASRSLPVPRLLAAQLFRREPRPVSVAAAAAARARACRTARPRERAPRPRRAPPVGAPAALCRPRAPCARWPRPPPARERARAQPGRLAPLGWAAAPPRGQARRWEAPWFPVLCQSFCLTVACLTVWLTYPSACLDASQCHLCLSVHRSLTYHTAVHWRVRFVRPSASRPSFSKLPPHRRRP